jgi:hypothetical protein
MLCVSADAMSNRREGGNGERVAHVSSAVAGRWMAPA